MKNANLTPIAGQDVQKGRLPWTIRILTLKAEWQPRQPKLGGEGPARPQADWRVERTRQYVSATRGRERRWRPFSTSCGES